MRRWRALVALLAGLAILGVLGVLLIGWFIAPRDDLTKSDVIVVVSGGDTVKRTTEGVTLWKQGWAPKIAFSGAAADQGISNAAVMRNQAIQAGVPLEATIIEERSETTKQNAEFLKPILDAQNMKTVIIVSSPYHTRRVKTTFHKVYGRGYHFIAHPATDSLWSRSTWWRQQEAVQLTWDELKKTFYVSYLEH